jgi:alkylated DNA repair protein (DNA oxidative demethylase)
MSSLFDNLPVEASQEPLEPGAMLLRGFAAPVAEALVDGIEEIARSAPFRHLVTRGGHTMTVAMTNAGRVGWVSDIRGYRYDPVDPDTGLHWPPLPPLFLDLARRAAATAGFDCYDPDACLINRYNKGARLGLHQDRDENDRWSPIVSVSLGVPATFLWGGQDRSDPVRRLRVENGDVAVWGGPARFVYHGIAPLKEGTRLNLTFRKVF